MLVIQIDMKFIAVIVLLFFSCESVDNAKADALNNVQKDSKFIE